MVTIRVQKEPPMPFKEDLFHWVLGRSSIGRWLVNPHAAGDKFCQYKNDEKTSEITDTLANGYSSESTQRELSHEYQHHRVKMVFNSFCNLVLWTKIASALEALIDPTFRNVAFTADREPSQSITHSARESNSPTTQSASSDLAPIFDLGKLVHEDTYLPSRTQKNWMDYQMYFLIAFFQQTHTE